MHACGSSLPFIRAFTFVRYARHYWTYYRHHAHTRRQIRKLVVNLTCARLIEDRDTP